MLGSFYTTISGLNAFRDQLSVISNNIANSGTTAYKAGDVSFAEVLSSSTSESSTMNVGNGVTMQDVAGDWTQGSIANTGNANNYAINGSGFFVVRNTAGFTSYTRDGQFSYNADGTLINAAGMVVQGYAIDAAGNLSNAYSDITISNAPIPATATSSMTTTMNLNSGTATGGTFSATVNTYDSLGDVTPVTITFTKVAPTVNDFTLNLSANTISAGDTIVIGGQTYTATNGSSTTTYNNFGIDLTNVGAGDTVTVGGVTYTAVNGGTPTPTEFDMSGGADAAATNLAAAIAANQGGVYGVADNGNGTLTITAGSSPLNASTVSTGNPSDIDVTPSTTVTPNPLAAGEFLDTGTGAQDATSLATAIVALQGGAYDVADNGNGTLTITAGSSPLNASTVVLGTATAGDIAISSSISNPERWTWTTSIPAATGTATGTGTLDFNSSGNLVAGTDPTISLALTNGAATPQVVTWDLYKTAGTTNGDLTQYAGDSSLSGSSQDGTATGQIQSISTDNNGIITASYSNGTTSSLFQIALANFNNYDGLSKSGNDLYTETLASGTPVYGVAGTGKFGTLASGSLETSNVDMATEMANMIVAQNSYSSCARMFTTESDILKTTIQMAT